MKKINKCFSEEYRLGMRSDKYVVAGEHYTVCTLIILMCIAILLAPSIISRDRKTLIKVGVEEGYFTAPKVDSVHFSIRPTAEIAEIILVSLACDSSVSDNTLKLLKKSDGQYFSSMLYGYLVRYEQER